MGHSTEAKFLEQTDCGCWFVRVCARFGTQYDARQLSALCLQADNSTGDCLRGHEVLG